MTNPMELLTRLKTDSIVRVVFFALIITVLFFSYSNAVPVYLRAAIDAKLAGLVFILYTLWLALTILWFRSWQQVFHSATNDL